MTTPEGRAVTSKPTDVFESLAALILAERLRMVVGAASAEAEDIAYLNKLDHDLAALRAMVEKPAKPFTASVADGASVAREFTGTSNGPTIRMGWEILRLRARVAEVERELEASHQRVMILHDDVTRALDCAEREEKRAETAERRLAAVTGEAAVDAAFAVLTRDVASRHLDWALTKAAIRAALAAAGDDTTTTEGGTCA